MPILQIDLECPQQPLLDLHAFVTELPEPLGSISSPEWLRDLLSPAASAPMKSDDTVRAAMRGMLRHGGYKPTGRGKPASEYLLRAASDGALGTINLAVDVGNAVSLHSGIPISVVDLDRARAPISVCLGQVGARYVFNVAGQEIDVAGLLCLCDAEGPCANAVKDAMRTKTRAETRRTLTLLWSSTELGDRGRRAREWSLQILERAGARPART